MSMDTSFNASAEPPVKPALEAGEVQFDHQGALARITLNRPRSLNALTLGTCELMLAQLRAWSGDNRVKAVVVRGAGDQAFSAGGDVIKLYEEGRAGRTYPFTFWRTEYRLDAFTRRFPKPYIALMDGIVMGGGVGISIHGSERIVTDRTVFAMPETGLGLFPDVGGSYFLPRLPGYTGIFLGLTGRRLTGAECMSLGIGTALVRNDRLADLQSALAAATTLDAAEIRTIVAGFSEAPGDAPILQERNAIDRHFRYDTVEAIIASLAADGGPWALAQRDILARKSPTALKITLKQLRTGAKLTFEDCMRLEWRLANRIVVGHDFYEGVRALLLDKDHRPVWRPASLAEVTRADVDAYFAPLPAGELDLADVR